MDFEYIYPVLILFGSFAVMLAIGVPITFAIGLSSLLSIITALPPDAAISVISQKMTVGLDGFTLLAIPFFVLAGNIMNTGGIARRLVNLAQALVGRLPGSLAHCNILANTLFGAISGSAVASAAAVGGIMSPLQEKEGYDPAFSAAVNIASAPIGLMIPPSNVLIVYSLASGGTSVAALFLAGYLPGILTAVALMFVAALYARRHHYPVAERINYRQFLQVFRESIPSLMLIFIIIGGIIAGVFTPTEASAIAVIYSLALAMIYREITLKEGANKRGNSSRLTQSFHFFMFEPI
ncbi:TRAP transporter large permease subunit, partial [Escherichia coli]|uniref:TRAP transporter large permease n=1 Tax=Escherichia coli TaxID=562 RepID=UPI0032C0DE40